MTEDESIQGPESDQVQVAETTGPLPDAVRSRVISLASESLGAIPADQLPASLRRVATFAPARRAKLAGNQIASALEADPVFRERLANQVRAQSEELATALDDGNVPPAADPTELAAVAYLLRPRGWQGVVARSGGAVETEKAAAATRQLADQVERLRRQLEDAAAELREVRDKNRQQVAALKAENSELRHKLGGARSRVRDAEEAALEAQTKASEAAASANAAAAGAESDARRLRSRVAELEQEVAVVRRVERAERGSGSLRARLLLDTLLDTVQGLRRELALPPVEGAPADAVEADVAEHGSRVSTGHGSLTPDDPVLLDELLSLPRVHLIIDGYNVTKTAWPGLPLEKQRERLLSQLGPLVARSGAEVTVVFDAAEKAERPVVKKPRGVRVLFSPFGVIADDVIRELVAAEPQGRPVVVISSDQALVADIRKMNGRPIGSPALVQLIARS